MSSPIVAGEFASERLMNSIKNRAREAGRVPPTEGDVKLVLRGLADHTAIMEMLSHRPDPTSPWPTATSVGRWFHDVADDLGDTIL